MCFTLVLLCGGKSLRMRYDLGNTNKVIAEISDRHLLHIILDYCAFTGIFNKIILCLGEDAEEISQTIVSSEYFLDGSWRGVDIMFLETGKENSATSRILQALVHVLDNTFFVSYADILSNINFEKMLVAHTKTSSQVTMSLVKAQMPYGRVHVNRSGLIYNFEEKPILNQWINAGHFIFEKEVFKADDENLELEKEFLPTLISDKKKIFGYKHLGFWKGLDSFKDLQDVRNNWRDKIEIILFPDQAK
jgi:glucose-1-phosphate cytidylyltransferase